MSFYIFRLDKLHFKHKRGNIPDSDIITFSILVNQVDRGHGTGHIPSITTNLVASLTEDRTENGLVAYPAENRLNMSQLWEVGPLEIAPGDDVQIVYTGTNISDEQLVSLDTQMQDEITLKLLSAVTAAAVAALTGGIGLVGQGIAAALGAIGDPVRSFLGYEPQGPCNGPVFSGAVPFSGSGLDNLAMAPVPPRRWLKHSVISETSFTRTYTDEATHDTDICGDMAETDVTFSALRVGFISVKWSLADRFPSRSYAQGLQQYGQPGTTISVKSLLGVQP